MDAPRHVWLWPVLFAVVLLTVDMPAWRSAQRLSLSGNAAAVEVILKSGQRLQGDYAPLSGLADVPMPTGPDGVPPLRPIMCLDDGLRRTFVSKRLVREVIDKSTSSPEQFKLWQKAKTQGRTIYSVGPIIKIEPFDEYGRRTFTMRGPNGPVDVVQGITLLAPDWAKVEGITHVWDMRIAPSSIPPAALAAMLAKQPDAGSLDHKKKVARFYLQMLRYEDACKTLEAALQGYEGDAQVKAEIDESLGALRRLARQRLVDELKRRREAGQHELVYKQLKAFPSEGVAGEILQEVGELVQKYEQQLARRNDVIQAIRSLLKQLDGETVRREVEPIVEEIAAELNLDTLDRMTAFRLAKDDKEMLPSEKLAIAISGWLLGSNAAEANLPEAVSTYKTRDTVREYLNDPQTLSRKERLRRLESREAASPRLVDLLLKHMKPPGKLPAAIEGKPGYYELQAEGLDKDQPVRYLVQLPPQYDPYRHYPTIVTLNGPAATPEMQIDWWAGPWPKKVSKPGATAGLPSSADGESSLTRAPDKSPMTPSRQGQATRHGYIVVAPQWRRDPDGKYHYSAREHAAVLGALRDACRHFSIDTDRVFLSGHSTGGDAAWDVALAHPDLWAGVVPITAWSRLYTPLYWENARNLPMYFVGGEKDARWVAENARDLDRYLLRAFNAVVVEYQGRGREHFQEEIQRIFDWMALQKRNFFPKEFKAVSMRPWDNFFWWVELADMPAAAMVAPEDWPPPRGAIPMATEAKLTATGGINLRTGAARATLWLSPEIIDMERRIKITVNGRRANPKQPFIRPDLGVLLEDARTRADRQHPFWAKFQCETGR